MFFLCRLVLPIQVVSLKKYMLNLEFPDVKFKQETASQKEELSDSQPRDLLIHFDYISRKLSQVYRSRLNEDRVSKKMPELATRLFEF